MNNISNIIIYSKSTCTQCIKAKELMDSRGIRYEDRAIGLRYTSDNIREHCSRLKRNVEIKSVPQIICVHRDGAESYIGGYTELVHYIGGS